MKPAVSVEDMDNSVLFIERMMINLLHSTGNLLNSLMGSGEDDGTEEAQEDSSPIELD